MAKSKKKALQQVKEEKEDEKQSKQTSNQEDEQFDFGGISSNVNFKRNMGCGG